jgi:hypothetical protein
MKTLRVYIETSVLGGCFDSEFEQWSNRLLKALHRREYISVLSSVTAAEVEQAPEQVKQVHADLIAAGAELLMVPPEAMDLLGQYGAKKILRPKFQNDLLHIALATVNIECGYKPDDLFSSGGCAR